MQAALYLIPTTLGGTETERVIPAYNRAVIASIKHFIVENIRSARRFFNNVDKSIDIDALAFYELSEHTDLANIGDYLDPLKNGNAMGLLSEAGCPAVADPGAAIVALAHKERLCVVPLSGPSSIMLALMASGFNGQNFAFCGYLPAKNAERAQKIKQLETRAYREKQTQIFIEAPYRNMQMLAALLSNLRNETRLCVAASLTCADEFIKSTSVAEWKKSPLPEINKKPAIFLLGG